MFAYIQYVQNANDIYFGSNMSENYITYDSISDFTDTVTPL